MIQESIGIDSLATWDAALKTVGALAVLYMGRGYMKMQAEMDKWRVYLFGINNDNGLNSRVKALEEEREDRLLAGSHIHRRGGDE